MGSIDTDQTEQKNQASVELQSQFIADMTYQIRTLSNAIVGFSDLLRHEELADSLKEYVTEIYNAGQDVGLLVDDFLELSQIKAGQLKVAIAGCSFGWLLDEIDSLMRPLASKKGLEFEILQPTELPANIETDSERLLKCLKSLISNAIKFTQEGYIHLRVAMEDRDGQPFIRFDVVDTGTGIQPDRQKTIFEPFAQVSDNLFPRPGLELTITRHVANLLGGDISVTSEPGSGSIFSLFIPPGVDVSSETLLEQHIPSTPISDQPEVNIDMKCVGHILLAEDQPSNRTVMTLLLETMGIRVSVAEDGLEAVQKAMAEPYDLILMDIKMPRLDGFEATRTLREEGIETPIISLSASSLSEHAESGNLSDFTDFLTKPVDSKKLYEVISKYLPVVQI